MTTTASFSPCPGKKNSPAGRNRGQENRGQTPISHKEKLGSVPYFLFSGLPDLLGVTRRPVAMAISFLKCSFPSAKLPFVA